MPQLFANNAIGSLSTAMTTGSTQIDLQTGEGALFPSPSGADFFLVTLHNADYSQWEIVQVSVKSGDSFTSIARGAEGSTPGTWPIGTYVSANITKGTLESMLNPKNNDNAVAAPTATDDETQGYGKGSRWVTSTDIYFCQDPSAGSAVWKIV